MVRKPAAFATLLFLSVGGLGLASTASAGTKVLVVGDSHTVGLFGKGVLSVLDGQPDLDTAMVARCSSSPQHWLGDASVKPLGSNCGHFERGYRDPSGKRDAGRNLKGNPPLPSVASLVSRGKPAFVVIALGTNQLPRSESISLESAKEAVDRLIDQAKSGGARCIWVGPPNEPTSVFSKANQDRFNILLRTATRAKGCLFVDSRDVTNAKDTAADRANHIHYLTSAGTKWGKAVGAEILGAIRSNGATSSASSPAGSSSGSAGGANAI
jgi:hypothetical protein